MSLSDEERRIMVELEIERAEKITEQFETLRERQYWDTLVNRMYYAVFHKIENICISNLNNPANSAGLLVFMGNR